MQLKDYLTNETFCKVKFSQSVNYWKTRETFYTLVHITTPMAMMMIRLGDKASNQFSSLEKNIYQRREEDRDVGDDLKQNTALVFFLSFLLVFLIMLSVFTFIIRLIHYVRRLRKTEYCNKYLAVEWREGGGYGARV